MHVKRTLQDPVWRWGTLTLLLLTGVATSAAAQSADQSAPVPAVSPLLSTASLPAPSRTSTPAPEASTASPAPAPSSGSTSFFESAPLPTTRAGWEGFGASQAGAGQGTLEIYGFGQADAIADFKQINPQWYDSARPSRLPAFANQFGEDGRFYLSPRQSRLGVKGELPTSDGNVKGQFEFDMFGVGPDAGVTTIRLRHAWGQWKQIGAGQTNSQFMDVDVFPNVIDYWGPNGMLFFRNTQIFYEFKNDARFQGAVAIEAPGASGDGGVYADRIELQNIQARFPLPDLTGHIRIKSKMGYLQIGGIVREIKYDDLIPNDKFNLSGSVTGWGLSLSSNVNVTKNDVLRLQYVYGHGIQNYFNDAPLDVGVQSNPGNVVTPIIGKALPVTGVVAFIDHNWSDKMSSSVGYSFVNVANSDLESPSDYHHGNYFVANVLTTPVKNVMMGGEFQWIQRHNFSDGFTVDDVRLQFSFKYSFGMKFGG
jgi:hypothetical protein